MYSRIVSSIQYRSWPASSTPVADQALVEQRLERCRCAPATASAASRVQPPANTVSAGSAAARQRRAARTTRRSSPERALALVDILIARREQVEPFARAAPGSPALTSPDARGSELDRERQIVDASQIAATARRGRPRFRRPRPRDEQRSPSLRRHRRHPIDALCSYPSRSRLETEITIWGTPQGGRRAPRDTAAVLAVVEKQRTLAAKAGDRVGERVPAARAARAPARPPPGATPDREPARAGPRNAVRKASEASAPPGARAASCRCRRAR